MASGAKAGQPVHDTRWVVSCVCPCDVQRVTTNKPPSWQALDEVLHTPCTLICALSYDTSFSPAPHPHMQPPVISPQNHTYSNPPESNRPNHDHIAPTLPNRPKLKRRIDPRGHKWILTPYITNIIRCSHNTHAGLAAFFSPKGATSATSLI